MNKRLIQFVLASFLFTILACDDFLDRQPLDQLTTETFYKTEADAELAILSVYSAMQDLEFHGSAWRINEIPSDNTTAGGTDPDFTPIDNFSVAADNGPVGNFWAIRYRLITLANVVIEKVSGMDNISIQKREEIEAEARFLRAVAYFDLVRIYGAVPLIFEAPTLDKDLLYPRTPDDDVYIAIKEDLEYASTKLPATRSGISTGRATRGAALAYKAKVHLTRREYANARDAAEAVMNLNVYQLMESYGDIFDLETSDNNRESIFEVQYTGCNSWGTGNALQAFFAPWGEGITRDRDGWGSQVPTGPMIANPGTTILDAYEEGDERKYFSVMTPGEYYPMINSDVGGYTYPSQGASRSLGNIKKYVVGAGSNICFMSTPMNGHLMRYSDVLLTYAEAIMEIAGGITNNPDALDAFNKVRTRAGLEAYTEIDSEKMLQERRVEFAFEGHRWYDLLRTGNAVETMRLHGKTLTPEKLLFPIPAGELEINPNLIQNPSY